MFCQHQVVIGVDAHGRDVDELIRAASSQVGRPDLLLLPAQAEVVHLLGTMNKHQLTKNSITTIKPNLVANVAMTEMIVFGLI